MKLTLLLTLLVGNSIQNSKAVEVAPMVCTVLDGKDQGLDCNELRQENSCAADETNLVTVKFSKLSICGAGSGTIDGDESKLVIRGPANQSANGGRLDIPWKEMEDVPSSNVYCSSKQYTLEVDTCKNHFNAQLFGYIKENGNDRSSFAYDSYMRRNCSLESYVKCTTPLGNDCKDMVTETCESGTFTYDMCYYTDFKDHDITIRANYLRNSCTGSADEECKETIAYMYGFENTFLPGFSNFSQQRVIGRSNQDKSCFTTTVEHNACETLVVPKVFMNTVGSVTKAYNNGVLPTEYRPCFSTTIYKENNLAQPPDNNRDTDFDFRDDDGDGSGGDGGNGSGGNGGDGGNGTGGDGGDGGNGTGGDGGDGSGDCHKSTIKSKGTKAPSPSTHCAKSPSSKGTKGPTSKGTIRKKRALRRR